MTVGGCRSQPPIPPNAIVSNNPCIDAILAEVAAPGQIGAISVYSHDPASASAPLAWGRRFPALGTSAEEMIAARPKLVLTGNLSSSGTNAALAKAGVRTLPIGVAATIAESEAQVMQIARAIGREGAGKILVARIEGVSASGTVPLGTVPVPLPSQRGQSLKGQSPAGQSAIIWQAGGFVPGKGTLQDEMLSRAGYRNASAAYGLSQWDVLPLETLIRNPPDVIFMATTSAGEDGRAAAMRARLLRHVQGHTRVVPFPDSLLFCGGPTIIEAMRVMRGAS
jgi:iron complex transport system substrate-binding protein